MKILDQNAIKQKIVRMAHQIAENNFHYEEIILMGINKRGYALAKLLEKQTKKIIETKVSLNHIILNPANPIKDEVIIEKPVGSYHNKTIIIVDDVANTGRTIFYAFRPLLDQLPDKIEVAVLVDRKHKLFPIQVDYVGLSLATTMRENIRVELADVENMEAYLD